MRRNLSVSPYARRAPRMKNGRWPEMSPQQNSGVKSGNNGACTFLVLISNRNPGSRIPFSKVDNGRVTEEEQRKDLSLGQYWACILSIHLYPNTQIFKQNKKKCEISRVLPAQPSPKDFLCPILSIWFHTVHKPFPISFHTTYLC